MVGELIPLEVSMRTRERSPRQLCNSRIGSKRRMAVAYCKQLPASMVPATSRMPERSGRYLGVFLMPTRRDRGLGCRRKPGTGLALYTPELSRENVLPMKRTVFTPTTDPKPAPPSALLLFIQQAQQALVDAEPVEGEIISKPVAPKHAA